MPHWPTKVSCEMVVEEWEAVLRKNGLLPDFADVLIGLVHSFHQGIPQHTVGERSTYYTPNNHSSALQAKSKIKESLRNEIATGRMFGPFWRRQVNQKFSFFQTSPLGAVISGDGSLRPIEDLLYPHRRGGIPSVNPFINSEDFTPTWDNFNVVARFIREVKEPVLLAVFNWENGLLPNPDRAEPMTLLNGQRFQRQHHFGYQDCVRRSCRLWVDNNLFVKSYLSELEMEQVVRRSNELGVKTSTKKFSPFAKEQKYVGFIWNGTNKTVRLHKEKLATRIKQIEEFLVIDAEFKYNEAEILAGRLNHVLYMVPQLRCYLTSLYHWMNEWADQSATRSPSPDVLGDLTLWRNTLQRFKPMRLIANPDPTNVGWVGNTLAG
ncbi:hypothetical protein PSTG_07484 [Puccinia striiformis f. sp. tritici PST-78]|uniref:Uncharacterized protein n=1 Tax=Puccinia striiformis f. sp. tritici PST-78 TaxID=1165861 RepID=A0A0L0VIT3_9BASI|nr:hypothetical protein PSTG_07484 [Puccinia striiformis f. sp. tritici PST-78]